MASNTSPPPIKTLPSPFRDSVSYPENAILALPPLSPEQQNEDLKTTDFLLSHLHLLLPSTSKPNDSDVAKRKETQTQKKVKTQEQEEIQLLRERFIRVENEKDAALAAFKALQTSIKKEREETIGSLKELFTQINLLNTTANIAIFAAKAYKALAEDAMEQLKVSESRLLAATSSTL